MSPIDAARSALDAAIGAVRIRRDVAADAAVQGSLDSLIDSLQTQRDLLDGDDPDTAVRAVADAVSALGDAVGAAPDGLFRLALRAAIVGLQIAQIGLWAVDRLARADADGPAPPPPTPSPKPAPDVPPLGAGHDFQSLAAEYEGCFEACVPADSRRREIEWYCGHVVKSRAAYAEVGRDLGIPWYFVGIIHGMESGFNFGAHLHNGDPLSGRTTNAPCGRPPNGGPPFSWGDSAKDALTLQGLAHQADWSLPRVLYRFEAYNGFGYRAHGLRTPYLWSFSNLYLRGKYVADGQFDGNAVSGQCGAAVMLKQLVASGVLQAQAGGVPVASSF